MPLSITDFLLLRHDHPVVDVRSEGEFEAGCVRGAINVPLLNNEARVIVGTAYKQKGQEEAIKEGFRLVGPRLADILDETKKNLRWKGNSGTLLERWNAVKQLLPVCRHGPGEDPITTGWLQGLSS